MRNFLLFFALFALTACGNDDDDTIVDYTAQNDAEIQTYLADNTITAQKSSSGLYYVINRVGTGARPNSTSNVTVVYKGYLTNGNVFDESNANGITLNLQQVIKGWTEGITYFNEGGNGKLFVPAHLGYGGTARTRIPAGSVLIFDINLLSVN